MKINLGILFLLASPQVFGQNNQLNGAWILTEVRSDNTLIKSDYADPGPYRWTSPNTHWLFKDKKIYEIEYPCCLLSTTTFKVDKEGDLFRTSGIEGRMDEMYSIQFRNDSLILDEKMLINGARYYFIRDTIPVKELTKFADGYINPVCLYGDWSIPTGEVSVEFDAINVWYPWKMKEQIHVDAKNLHHYWANNRFYLEVDGIKRPFKVGNVSLQDNDLILIPESWVKEYIKKQKLDPYQISNVWLRKIN